MRPFVVSAILALTVAALTSAPLRAAQAAGVPQRPPQAPAPTANPEPEPAKPAHTPPPTHEPSPSPTPQPAATSSPTTEKEFKQLVVMIRASLSGSPVIGAGVVVGYQNDRLYVATANHVVRTTALTGEAVSAEDIHVEFSWLPGESSAAKLLTTFDETLDLAVLAIPDASKLAVPPLAWAVLVRPDTLSPGEKVIPVGNPLGESWFVPHQPHLVSRVNSQTIETEGELKHGHSGGALTTEDWGIVGLLRREGGLLGESTRIDLVVEQLKRWKYPVDATFKTRATTAGTGDSTMTLPRERQAAEAVALEWMDAMIARNFNRLAAVIEAPFYFDNELLVSRENLENRFKSVLNKGERGGAEPAITIQRIKARTVAEARAEGQDLSRDRFGNSMTIDDGDWMVTAITGTAGRSSTDGTLLLIRKVNGVLKVVGFWN